MQVSLHDPPPPALRALAALRLRRLRAAATSSPAVDDDWRSWLAKHFPTYVSAGFAPRHERLWFWFADLRRGEPHRAHIALWPRGGAKSSTAELGTAWLCARKTRRFVLYVSETQDQADKHVSAIATLLERLGIQRAINVYGNSKGWRRQELRTADGFNVSALGLDTAARGVKLDEARPDLVIFDDVDARHDSEATTRKKIEAITQTVIPAGSVDVAVLFLQNMVHRDSIAAQLVDGRADFLLDRLPVTIEPAIVGLQYERVFNAEGSARYVITAGTPTWEGQSLATCEKQMTLWGRRAFLREAQHEVRDAANGLWRRERDIDPYRVGQAPELVRTLVAVDPSITATGDACGIIVMGKGTDGHGYVLADRTIQGSPRVWAEQAVAAHHYYRCNSPIVAEANQGGQMVELTIRTVPNAPSVELVHASKGKVARAEPVQKLYEEGRIHHVGYLPELENELCEWEPGDESPNRLDAAVYGATKLALGAQTVSLGTLAI